MDVDATPLRAVTFTSAGGLEMGRVAFKIILVLIACPSESRGAKVSMRAFGALNGMERFKQ